MPGLRISQRKNRLVEGTVPVYISGPGQEVPELAEIPDIGLHETGLDGLPLLVGGQLAVGHDPGAVQVGSHRVEGIESFAC